MTNLLFAAANPNGGSPQALAIDQEHRAIQQVINASPGRADLHLIARLACTYQDLAAALNTERPEIAHFSGHGYGMQGIVLCDDIGVATPALTAALETLFGNFTQVVRLAFLNSCHSEAQARALSTIGVECCIGTSDTIDDAEAFAFARTFYTAVAAGANTQSAFNQAIGALQAAGLPNSYRIFGPNPTNQILRVPQRIELVHYIAGRQTNPTSYMIRLAVRNTSNAVLRDYSVDIQNSNTFEVLRLIRENETYRRLIHGTVVENGQQIYRFNSIDQDRIHPAQSFDIACFNENNLADPNREIEIPYVVSHDGIQNRGTVRIRIGDLH